MEKISVKVYFEAEANDGSKRTCSRLINYINPTAADADLAGFKTAFTALLGKEVKRAEKVSVMQL